MIEYKFDKNSRINIVKMYDDVTLQNLIVFIEEFWSLDHPSKIKMLYDLRKANFLIKSKDVMKVSDTSLSMIKEKESVKSAFVVDNPKQTALSVIFSNLSKFENVKREVFSTYESAVSWLEE